MRTKEDCALRFIQQTYSQPRGIARAEIRRNAGECEIEARELKF